MTYIIAEAGINHSGSLQDALLMVRSSAACGASAVKFQAYSSDERFKSDESSRSLVRNCELTPSDFKKLADESHQHNIDFGITCFSSEWVFELKKASIKPDFFKIASCDHTNFALINSIHEMFPDVRIIISLGTTTLDDLNTLITKVSSFSRFPDLLHCVSAYPCPADAANLSRICFLSNNYPDFIVGYSDHTRDTDIVVSSIALGAKIVEVHFTLDHARNDIDDPVSYDPYELKNLILRSSKILSSLGTSDFSHNIHEVEELQYRLDERVSQ